MDEEQMLDSEEGLPSPDEVMDPLPSEEQEWLWQNIAGAVSERALERETDWRVLPPEIRKELASLETANRLGKIGVEFSLSPEQVMLLSGLVKYLFLRRVEKNKFESTLADIAGLERNIASAIVDKLKDIIGKAGVFHALEKKPGEPTIAPEIVSVPRTPPQRETADEPPPPPAGEAGDDQPFILHEEKPTSSPVVELPHEETRSSFSFTPEEPPETMRPQEPKAVPVRIETEGGGGKPKARIVHYSNLRTPLDADANDAK